MPLLMHWLPRDCSDQDPSCLWWHETAMMSHRIQHSRLNSIHMLHATHMQTQIVTDAAVCLLHRLRS